MLNVTDVLSVVLSGTLGRSGRKRARKASRFLSGNRGFLGTSAIVGAAGVAWGIYDTLKAQQQNSATPVPGVPQGWVPPVPGSTVPTAVPSIADTSLDPLKRIIQLAISAAKADGTFNDDERAMIMERARESGLEHLVEAEVTQTRSLADIVRGVTDPAMKKELYVLAFAIVRADETVSGAERIYLAQLAHQLGLDTATVQAIENETAANIDAQSDTDN